MEDPVTIKIVGPVDVAVPDPWRTRADYEQDQKESRERHAMFQEQHRLLHRAFRANLVAVGAAIVAAVAACISALR